MEKTVVGGRFVLERLAGTGGMARVYRALDRETGGPVAVKLLHDQSAHVVERFSREADVLAALAHPAIVRHVAHGMTHDGELWLAMEWLEGETLAERLKTRGLTIGESVSVCRQVAEALGAAHARGVVHRDVKPSNVFLASEIDLGVKILDFGVAHVAHADAGKSTKTGVLLGTPGYMAPEQARGDRGIDARADVFSLGCVLFECLTGRAAFVGENFMAVLAKILLEQVPRVVELRADVLPALDALVTRMLSKDPLQRPSDGRAVASLLEEIGEVGGGRPLAQSIAAAPSITGGEQRFLSVVLAGAPEGSKPARETAGGTELMATIEQPSGALSELRAECARFGGSVERLLDGAIVVTFTSRSAATDQVAQAARCALALRSQLDAVPIALATGRGVVATRFPVGEVIDRAARLVRVGKKRGSLSILIDETTSGLLDPRFEVSGDAGALALSAEAAVDDAVRTLLGKPVPCVGREREISMLEGIFDESRAEPIARAVLVVAPPGIGKSRVRAEMVRRLQARRERVEIWLGRGDPLRAGSPFGLVGQAIRGGAGVKDGEPLDVKRRKLWARIARNVREADVVRVAEFLSEASGLAVDEASASPRDAPSLQLRAARQDPQLMGDQIRRAFEDLVLAECDAQPLVLVLEDLHWGDLPTVQLVDAALRRAREHPFVVVAFARPEVHEKFPRLWSRDLNTLPLHELKRSSCAKLVRDVLGERATPALVEDLVERAAGNAFYLEELVRAVAEGRGEKLPETVMAMVEARIDALDAEARRVLRAASVFGQRFTRAGVAALLGGSDKSIALAGDWLDQLVLREVITARRRTGAGDFEKEYAFRHALVRDTAYAMLTPDDCALAHRLAGAWLESKGETDPVVLAEHFERGGQRDKAIKAWRTAAEQALEGDDIDGALVRAARGVELGASGDLLGALELVSAEGLTWRARYADAADHASAALSLLPHEGAGWFRAAAVVAETAGKLAENDRLSFISDVLGAAEVKEASRRDFARAASRAVSFLCTRGSVAPADALVAKLEALRAKVGAGDPATRAWIDAARSWRAWLEGDVGASLACDSGAAEAFEAIGDLRHACEQRSHVAYDHLILGAFAEAEQEFCAALLPADRLGLASVSAMIRHNLGFIFAHRGAIAEGIAMENEALASYAAQGYRRMEGNSHAYLSRIHLLAGDRDAAVLEARRAVEALEEDRPNLVNALAILARAYLARGEVKSAEEAIARGRQLSIGLPGIGEGDVVFRAVIAETCLAANDHDGAAKAIREARALLVDRASKIRDPELRESFLMRVPDHAKTLELARSIGG